MCKCAELSPDLVNQRLVDLPELAVTLVEMGAPSQQSRCYFHRCTTCGAIWQESLEAFMHADVPVLARTGLSATGTPVHVKFNLAQNSARLVSST